MFREIGVTISAAVFVLLAIALAPHVPTALATARTPSANDEAMNRPIAEQPCAAFESWFLDPSCRQTRAKTATRTKGHLAHK
jgi:hypothetical protein